MISEEENQFINSLALKITGQRLDVNDEKAVKRFKLALSALNEVDLVTQVSVLMALHETEQRTLIITKDDQENRERLIKEWLQELNRINDQLSDDIKKAYRQGWEWE